MKEIVCGILLVFVFFGFVAIAYYAILKILSPKKNERYTVVIAARADSGDITNRLCSEALRIDMLCERNNGAVVVMDCGMSDKNRRACEDFCRESRNCYICRPDELAELIVKQLELRI
ncbi:MAG: hypothetical protein FWF05_02860 [Oscillospiraceae bacterium]|nr:hypothetical protein [Oscillospiraceae bacterium]